MGLNITYVVWSIIFDKFIIGSDIGILTIISSVMVIVGVYFVAREPETEKNETIKFVEAE